MSEERELKLEFRTGDAARIKRSPLLGRRTDRRSETLTSVYFDTPERRLAREGYSLRVRHKGDGFTQTLKGNRRSGIGTHIRDEWEWPVPTEAPDLSLLTDTPIARQVKKRRFKERLAPIFETKVERTTRRVRQGEAEVEIALDEGTVVAGAKSEPIRSLELELLSGPTRALYELAGRFPKGAALDLDVRSKSERGYALLGDEAFPYFKAEPIAIDPDATAGTAFQAIAKSCLRQFRLNVPGILAGRDPEALHQARVAIRRCRSAMSFFEPIIADAAFESHSEALAQLSHALGSARDLDVFLAPDALPLPIALRTKAEAERDRRYAGLMALLESSDHRIELLAFVGWIEHGAWTTAEPNDEALPIHAFAAARFDLWRRKIKKRGRDLVALDPQDRHRCRIAAKKLRYAAEFLDSTVTGKTARKRQTAFLEFLEALQTELGSLNDRAFGGDLIRELDGAASGIGSAGPYEAQAEADVALLGRAEQAYKAFCKAKPYWT